MASKPILPSEPPLQCRNITEPDPDIAGLGVIISFVSSGIVTLLLSIAYYFLFYNPRDEASLQATAEHQAAAMPNPVDERILSFQPRLHAWLHQHWPNGVRVAEKGISDVCAVRSLSDLQIVLGLCILIAGFIGIDWIAAFYWHILVYVAWFSNLTHQCALIVLRPAFRENNVTRNWRLFLMTALVALLLAASIPTMYFNWHLGPDTIITKTQPMAPIRCFFASDLRSSIYAADTIWVETLPLTESTIFFSTAFSLLFLIVSYSARLLRIFPSASFFIKDKVAAACSLTLRKLLIVYLHLIDVLTLHQLNPSFWFFLVESPVVAVYLSLRISSAFITSSFFDLVGICFGCAWALFRIINQKNLEVFAVGETPRALRSIVSFGQLLPIVLLISTVFSLLRSLRTAGIEVQLESRQSAPSGIERRIPSSSAASPPALIINSKRLLSLSDERRWERVGHLLHQDHHLEHHWLSPILVNIGTGTLSGLAAMLGYLILAVISPEGPTGDYWVSTLEALFLHPCLLLLTLFWCSVVVCVSAAGLQQSASRRLYWILNLFVAAFDVAYCALCLLSGVAQASGSSNAYGAEEVVSVLPYWLLIGTGFCCSAYLIALFIRCVAPRSWGWRPAPPNDAAPQSPARDSMEMQVIAISDSRQRSEETMAV